MDAVVVSVACDRAYCCCAQHGIDVVAVDGRASLSAAVVSYCSSNVDSGNRRCVAVAVVVLHHFSLVKAVVVVVHLVIFCLCCCCCCYCHWI